MSVQEYRHQIPAVVASIEEACEFVARIARQSGMDEEAVYRCYLSVEEVITNVIEHGYHYKGENHRIEIVCTLHTDKLIIEIIDDAREFNPLNREDPDPGAELLNRQGGGWGIYFVKKFMDKVSYSYQDNRNRLRIEKQF